MKKIFAITKKYLAAAFAMLMLSSMFSALCAVLMMSLIDESLNKIDKSFTSGIKSLLIAVTLAFVFKLLSSFVGSVYRSRTLYVIKKGYVKQVFKKELRELFKNSKDVYLSAFLNDIGVLETQYVDGYLNLFQNIAALTAAALLVFYASPSVLILGLAVGVLTFILSKCFSKILSKKQIEKSELQQNYTNKIKEILSGFLVIKQNAMEAQMINAFAKESKHLQTKCYEMEKLRAAAVSVQYFISNSSMFIMMSAVVFLSFKGAVTTGGVVLILQNIDKILNPLTLIMENLTGVLSSASVQKKLSLEWDEAPVKAKGIEIEECKRNVTFREVTFHYLNSDAVLENLSVNLEKGKKYLILGGSATGKSTILKLLDKTLLPTAGEILLDDIPLNKLSDKDYSRMVAHVSQQTFLFEDTIRNNLSLYNDYTDEAINRAVREAGLSEYVEKLPNGLDYMVLDNGKNLSGGEKKRIAIARALLSNVKLLLLDEIFAGLDKSTAVKIEDTILSLDMTVIHAAHVAFKREGYDGVFTLKNKTLQRS